MADTNQQIISASAGFDHLFSNEISLAKESFAADNDSAFHLLGAGVSAFMEAAMSGQTGLVTNATTSLNLAEVHAKKQIKLAKQKKADHTRQFALGLESEVILADATVLLALTHALSESYMGYLQCIYALNNAHSKLTKLFKTVFPAGLDGYKTPATTPGPSRMPSIASMHSQAPSAMTTKSGFFGRWGSSSLAVPPVSSVTFRKPKGPAEELIVAGTCLGFGLFNLVFSLLPKKIQGVVGFFGFNHDRKLALQALSVSAARKDVHSVFAGLVLMTYHGVILLLCGFQADPAHILKQYNAIIDDIEPRYPSGSLWILNRAKILRMSGEPGKAIEILQNGLRPDRPNSFPEADTLLVFELAWTLLQQRRYQDAAEAFINITEINAWSHATYFFLAAGCYISLGNVTKAQELFDRIPGLLEKKNLPTETFIRKKLTFYQEKQKRRGGKAENYAEAIKISPAEELAIFWNTHDHITKDVADEHIKEWEALSPAKSGSVSVPSQPDLDTPDELAIRSLLLGICHRSAKNYSASRTCLTDAYRRQPSIQISTWVGGIAMFELAVLDLKECAAGGRQGPGGTQLAEKERWPVALKSASEKLDQALTLATATTDLSSRLDSRISMLKDAKRDFLQIS